MRNFKGFTLTELMVALAVIGILTAVVTPAVMKIKPNKNKMMIKKAYYTAENIVGTLINNQLYYPDMSAVCQDTTMANGSNIYCAGGFDYTEEVTDSDGITYSGDSKFAQLFQSKLNVQTGTCFGTASNCEVTTTDGMTWFLPSWSKSTTSSTKATIIVDVNGSKSPNCTQDDTTNGCSAEDFDRFRIEVREDGRMNIHASDAKAIEYISINASVAKD